MFRVDLNQNKYHKIWIDFESLSLLITIKNIYIKKY